MARAVSAVQSIRIAAQKTLEETHQILVDTAKREHRKVMLADPRPQSFSRTVDGVLGAPEERVRPDGRIVYRYSRLEEVVRFAMETLFDLSPVLSGAYRNAHTLFLNGVAVADLREWRAGDEVIITNTMPYARKIDLGVMRMRVPGSSRVYEQAVTIARRRFGNTARIIYDWRGFMGGATVAGHQGNKSELRYPAMVIREL
jgi:hypothetical protein